MQCPYKKHCVPMQCFLWSRRRESNPRPSPYHGDALPSELQRHLCCEKNTEIQKTCKD
ncbi:MAG: hypothetical protein UU48_C0001G0161 [Candidatus Uhrbacteria bacterium GW2011_GWF2_41_16]|uniref:Uncharacterized protein n=2 Tax=Candidatus Uhriibacteriota TaxID=1752732 RepID=A0A0G0VGQ0_9BACT|nr:MAG: hypothetical protein UU31_C0002G0024 [Candidatus Uhrbacteria bacterium GW2011_GWA2_41_10]KKR87867.1 MAG: hypothetical protein UU35_C0001G0148 [Candidatus Uhrbacteria bacterium GW2011_GWC2_41_11]KKR98806.1 MAG: hypothetical protein UU48_C0001G0161 [Candidatus Uhrbacteria bacterium GW2011_GWF2_41_16]